MPRWRGVAIRTLAVTIGLAAGLVVAEVVLRVAHVVPSAGLVTVSEKQFSAVPGMYAPRQQLTDRRIPALTHQRRIDSLGYRGDDFPRVKPAEEFRVLMLGDSFTHGDFVNDSETLPAQLGSRLAHVCRAPFVINGGVSGTTIVDAEYMLARAMPLEPDLVILMFFENDVTDLAGRSLWDEAAADRKAKSAFPLSVLYPIVRHSALWHLVLKLRGKIRAQAFDALALQPMSRNPDSSVTALRDEYARHFVRLRDTLSNRGILFALAVYPAHEAMSSEDQRGQLEWIEKVGTEAGVPTVSFLPSLATSRRPIPDLYLLPHDTHASARGYSIAADTLSAFLTSIPSVRSRCLL